MDVGIVAHFADADENVAGEAPVRLVPHRWRRDAQHLPHWGGRPSARDTCLQIPDDGLRVAPWNTRGVLGCTDVRRFPEKNQEPLLTAHCHGNGITCLPETHGEIEFFQGIHGQFHMVGTFLHGQVNAGCSVTRIRTTLLHGDTAHACGPTDGSRPPREDSLRKQVIDDRQRSRGTWLEPWKSP